MKTIKEILEHNGVYEDCHSYQVIGAINESMKQYAKQACKEQRQTCAERATILVKSELNETEFDVCEFDTDEFKEIVTVSKDSIRNAPEPELK